jgi:hypothetical protein
MVNINWKKNLMLALPVTAVVWLVGFLFTKLGLGAVQQLYTTIPATSAITQTLGAKGIALIGGLVPLNLTIPLIAVLFVSAFLTLVIGNLVVDLLFKGKTLGNLFGLGTDAGRIATYILLGATVAYLIFAGFNMPSRLTILGVLIHTLLVAVGSVFVAKTLKIGI